MVTTKAKSTNVKLEDPTQIGDGFPLHSRTRTLVETYYDVQKLRIALAGRVFQLETQGDVSLKEANEDSDGKITSPYVEQLQHIEESIKKDIKQDLKGKPIYDEFLSKVHGMGPVLSAGIIAYIEDIGKFSTVSRLWAYAGLHVVPCLKCENCEHDKLNNVVPNKYEDNMSTYYKLSTCTKRVMPKRRAGQKANWNTKFGTHLWKCTDQFNFQKEEKSWYKKYVSDLKRSYGFTKNEDGWHLSDEKRDEWISKGVGVTVTGKTVPMGHLNNRALRKTRKLFLSHVWAKWRELEGLEISKPWIIEHGGHSDYISPDEIIAWEAKQKEEKQ